MDEIYTRLSNFPTSICAFTVRDRDGDYNIYLNARISHERRVQAYEHELKHIKRGDFQKSCSADLIEIYAHR